MPFVTIVEYTPDEHNRFIAQYHEHKEKLFNYLMVRLNYDRQQAEDLLMDVFLKAYEKLNTFDAKKGNFQTWIFTLTHNHLINFWRRNKKSVSLDKMEEKGIHLAVTESGQQVDKAIESQKIHHVLSLMKEGEKEVITLRYLQEMDYAEIAKITGKKEGAIRTGLSRALGRFSELYQKIYP